MDNQFSSFERIGHIALKLISSSLDIKSTFNKRFTQSFVCAYTTYKPIRPTVRRQPPIVIIIRGLDSDNAHPEPTLGGLRDLSPGDIANRGPFNIHHHQACTPLGSNNYKI